LNPWGGNCGTGRGREKKSECPRMRETGEKKKPGHEKTRRQGCGGLSCEKGGERGPAKREGRGKKASLRDKNSKKRKKKKTQLKKRPHTARIRIDHEKGGKFAQGEKKLPSSKK